MRSIYINWTGSNDKLQSFFLTCLTDNEDETDMVQNKESLSEMSTGIVADFSECNNCEEKLLFVPIDKKADGDYGTLIYHRREYWNEDRSIYQDTI